MASLGRSTEMELGNLVADGDSSAAVSMCLGRAGIPAGRLGTEAMDSPAETVNLAFAALSFAAAILSIVIHELSGTWPTEFGFWGSVLFVLVGIAIVGTYVLAHEQAEGGAARSEPRKRRAEKSRTND